MSELIILIVDDLMFQPRLEQGVRHLGYTPLVATDESALTRGLFRSPVLVIIDLFNPGFDWQALIGLIKKSKAGPVPVLGFGPHVDLSLREQALAAGCTAFVGRGAITTNLAGLIERHKWVTDLARCGDAPPDLLVQGLELFNRGDYFECHEVIEDAWNAEPSPIRVMYQGILQIGVACHHIQGRNWRGAMKLLERGLPKIRRFGGRCMGIDLARLTTEAEAIRDELVRLGPDGFDRFDPALLPKIKYEQS